MVSDRHKSGGDCEKRPNMTVSEIAERVGGRVVGDNAVVISNISALDEPVAGTLSLVTARNFTRVKDQILAGEFAALIINEALVVPDDLKLTTISVADPILAYTKIAKYFIPDLPASRQVSATAMIDPSVKLGADVSIGHYVVIGAECEVGDNTVIHPHVVLYPGVKIGQGCVLHAGAVIRERCELGDGVILQPGSVIGGDGFGYVGTAQGIRAVPQLGIVQLGDRVEVGANSCVDRATIGTTKLGNDTKLDNLVQIGHNVKVGHSTLVCAGVGVAGSARIGNGVTIGAMAGVAGHISMCDKVRVGAKSGVITDIERAGDYAGFPAVPMMEYRRQMKCLADLSKQQRAKRRGGSQERSSS